MLSSYQAEIEKLRKQLKDSASVNATPQINSAEKERIEKEQQQAKLEKTVIITELARRQIEVEAATKDKMAMEERVRQLEAMVMPAGRDVKQTSEFQEAIQREKQLMQLEAESQRTEIELERERFRKEKEAFEQERKFFSLKTVAQSLQSANNVVKHFTPVPNEGSNPEGAGPLNCLY